MEQLNFKLDSFEGPLDLLLMLIRKNKVNICDIPIALILDQYLEVMEEMKETDLEISSEFLVLAATLLHIKSKMLLPKDEDQEDDGTDPREELVKRLTEYKKIKDSVFFFSERQNIGTYMYYKVPDAIERPPAELETKDLTPENLLIAYKRAYALLERKQPPPKHSFSGIVGHEKVSIRTRVSKIWKIFSNKATVMFRDLFKGTKSRPELVASFLAVLELIRIKKIQVEFKDENISNPKISRIDDNSPELDLNLIEE